jgi:hypothetical protein
LVALPERGAAWATARSLVFGGQRSGASGCWFGVGRLVAGVLDLELACEGGAVAAAAPRLCLRPG